MYSWALLLLAIILEVCGTISMKLSDGFANLLPSILIFVFYIASFSLLVLALKKIDVGIAYAIWAGTGTALIAIIGIIYFKESVSLLKIISISLIIIGVIGIHLSESK